MIRIPMELRETVIAIARQAGDAIMRCTRRISLSRSRPTPAR